jgi:hypothetical protein
VTDSYFDEPFPSVAVVRDGNNFICMIDFCFKLINFALQSLHFACVGSSCRWTYGPFGNQENRTTSH